MTGISDHAERDFALRAAAYLREQGLTEEEVQQALQAELGLRKPEAEAVMAVADAA